jgi:hypothetical protein
VEAVEASQAVAAISAAAERPETGRRVRFRLRVR